MWLDILLWQKFCPPFLSRMCFHRSPNWSMLSTWTRRKWAQKASQQDCPSTACRLYESWAHCQIMVCNSLTHLGCAFFSNANVKNLTHSEQDNNCLSVLQWGGQLWSPSLLIWLWWCTPVALQADPKESWLSTVTLLQEWQASVNAFLDLGEFQYCSNIWFSII